MDFKCKDMDIFDFTIGEFQTLHRTRAKAKLYLHYLTDTQSVFSHLSKERRYIASMLPTVNETNAHIWDAHLKLFPAVKLTLEQISTGKKYEKSEYNKLLRYVLSERDILSIYHINSAISEETPRYTCFHADKTKYPSEFKISLAFTEDYKSELACFVQHDFSNQAAEIDFSRPIKIYAHTNLQSLIVHREEMVNTVISLKRGLPLNYILENFCEFSLLHSLNSHTLNTLINEQVRDALGTIAFSYDLDCIVKSAAGKLDDGMNAGSPKEYEVTFKSKQHTIENKYIERIIDCNNTLIFSS